MPPKSAASAASSPHQDASSSAPETETGGSQPRLRVEKASVPGMRKAFQQALDKLTPQVGDARTDLRIRPWAGDPVSDEAAQRFNDRSVDGAEAALGALEGYQQQLQSAVRALLDVETQYRAVEQGNTDIVRTQNHGC